jgi:multisubunit Na+/H+ antiporter MnhB subunit
MVGFYQFVFCCLVMVIASLLTRHGPDEQDLPTLIDSTDAIGSRPTRAVWILWGVLGTVMVLIYTAFQSLSLLLEG